MRNIFTLLSILQLLAFNLRAQNLNTSSVAITGTITGYSSSFCLIEITSPEGLSTIDTLTVCEGNFFFKKRISEPVRAQIRFENETFFCYLDPGSDNVFRGSFKPGLEGYLVGSPTHLAYTKRQDMVDSVKQSISKEHLELIELFSIDSAFIISNPKSYYSYVLVKLYFHEMALEGLETFYSLITPELRTTTLVRDFEQRLMLRRTFDADKVNLDSMIVFDTLGQPISFKSVLESRKIILLDFWASWCVPCRQNSPYLKSLFSMYNSSGLSIVSLSLDTDQNRWRTAITNDGLNLWTNVIEGSKSDVSIAFKVRDVPAYMLLDSSGRMLGRFSGNAVGKAKLSEAIKNLASR